MLSYGLNRKGELRLGHTISLIIVFFLVLVGCFSFFSGFTSFYNVQQDENFTATYNALNTTSSEAVALGNTMQDKLEGSESPTITDGIAVITGSVYGAVKLPFTALSTITTLIREVNSKLGLPGWFIAAILALIGLTISALFISLIMRYRY